VAAPVESVDVVAGGGETGADQVPRVGVLEKAVQQQNDRRALTPLEEMKAQAVGLDEPIVRRGANDRSSVAWPRPTQGALAALRRCQPIERWHLPIRGRFR